MSETGDAANDANPSLFPLDKLAAADLYGPAGTGGVETTSASGVNSVSNWMWDATTETLTQTAVSANETIHGTSVNDIIYGYDYGGSVPTSGTISLFGLDGTNTLYAGSGTTDLYGGPDTNTLVGGAGNDSFYVYSDQTSGHRRLHHRQQHALRQRGERHAAGKRRYALPLRQRPHRHWQRPG